MFGKSKLLFKSLSIIIISTDTNNINCKINSLVIGKKTSYLVPNLIIN